MYPLSRLICLHGLVRFSLPFFPSSPPRLWRALTYPQYNNPMSQDLQNCPEVKYVVWLFPKGLWYLSEHMCFSFPVWRIWKWEVSFHKTQLAIISHTVEETERQVNGCLWEISTQSGLFSEWDPWVISSRHSSLRKSLTTPTAFSFYCCLCHLNF